MADPETPAAPSPEDMNRLMEVARASAEAVETEGTTEERTSAVETAIRESAAEQFPAMSDAQLQQIAEKLAPIVVAMTVEPMTDGMIDRLRQLEVVFTPGQGPPAEEGSPEQAAETEAAAAPEETVETVPQKKTFAERFAGR